MTNAMTNDKVDREETLATDDVVSAVSATMFVVDEDLVVQHISNDALRILGYSRDEVVGKMTCAELCKSPLCGGPDCTIKKCWQMRQNVVGETVCRTRDGDEIPIRAYCSALFDDDGKPIGGMEVIVDISEQKNAVSEIVRLTRAALDGELSERARVETANTDDFREVLKGLNEMLEAFIQPINMIADYVSRINAGEIPEKIEDEYRGDFNTIKNSINSILDGLQALVEVAEVLEAAANRDLTARVQGDYVGIYAETKDNLNSMLEAVEDAFGQVAAAVVQVAEASGQISSGSQSLAEGAAEQASALEEVSSTLEEMTAMTRQNANNAGEARNLSEEATDGARKGVAAMARMADAMSAIQTSSAETAKIVKTIDEIAFQTNLLALNAAVEAARAGDAGKGFAVVAEEVRNLAQRSAEAAKNTADMIEEAVKNAEGGVTISQEVSEALSSIETGANSVNELIGEIAAASEEQAQGLDQINTAVGEMDTVTQNNAANSEESASAAEELSAQAQELRGLVETFRLSSAGQGAVTDRSLRLVGKDERPAPPKPSAGQNAKQTPARAIPLDDDDEDLAALSNF